ncbi:MAG: ABC transporter ATP-binding protein [Phycisphaerae bacterium]|nr:ABC transporter ATP-binding protein [Phycisphaerae bacterium]
MIDGLLTLSDICVRSPGRTLLQIDHLHVPAGDFVGIVGTNGAGKTTLLKVAAGLIRPDGGQVTLDGSDLTRLSGWRKCRLRKHIGYIPQSAEYNAELPFTVREVVAMGRTSVRPLLTRLNADDYGVIDRWIDALGLSDRRHQTFRSLSGGEQQKVLIARAMAQDPRILMLDEPCASLDFHWKYEISEIVERLHRQTRMTVLMVSHDTGVLPSTCRRVVLLAEGRLLGDGDVDAILTPEKLRQAYHGDLVAATVGGRRHILAAPSGGGSPTNRET